MSIRFYPTRHDLDLKTRTAVVEVLSITLATTLDLQTQTKQAHWNVKGSNFLQLHELFDKLATELEDYVDLIAERITALGASPQGTARVAASTSLLSEYPLDISKGFDHLSALADRYASYGSHLRGSIDHTSDLGDADTADLYTEISRTIDKRLWFLEAHLTE